MVTANNPAGRLYLILDELRSKSKETRLQDAWADIFKIDKDDLDELLIAVSDVIRLVQETKNKISRQNVDQSLYQKPFVKIQRVFTLSMGHQSQNVQEFLDDATMVGLEHGAELLSRTENETVIDTEVLDDLQAQLKLLIERVLCSDLPKQLRNLLLDELRDIQRVILRYRIFGTDGLRDKLKHMIGSLNYYQHEMNDEVIEQDKDKELFRDVIGFLNDVLGVVANSMTIMSLIGTVSTHLLGPGS